MSPSGATLSHQIQVVWGWLRLGHTDTAILIPRSYFPVRCHSVSENSGGVRMVKALSHWYCHSNTQVTLCPTGATVSHQIQVIRAWSHWYCNSNTSVTLSHQVPLCPTKLRWCDSEDGYGLVRLILPFFYHGHSLIDYNTWLHLKCLSSHE